MARHRHRFHSVRCHLRDPEGLSNLPVAIAESIVLSLPTIARDILSNGDTYKAIAIEAAKRGGASAAARFLCRLLEEGLEQLAKELAAAVSGAVADTIAAAAELAGVLITVALLGVKGVVSFFQAIWDEIKSWFGDDSKKKEAEDKVRKVRADVEVAVQDVDTRINAVKQQIGISTLTTGLDSQGDFRASVVWNLGANQQLSAGSKLSCRFKLLGGEPGTPGGAVLLDVSSQTFPNTWSWSKIPGNSQFAFNAAVEPILIGYTFIDSKTVDWMNNAISLRNRVDNSGAKDFAPILQGS